MPSSVRDARLADAERIARVEVEAWRDTYPTLLPTDYLVKRLDVRRASEAWRRRLARRPRNTVVAEAPEAPGGIAGYAAWGRSRLASLPGGELYELYLLPSERDRGWGRRLCSAVAERLVRCGTSAMYVEVLEGNPARFFYEAMGARLTARTKHPFAGGALPALVYAWDDLPWLVRACAD